MRDAVLLSCHGTVSRPEDIPAFLANIRRGRPAEPALVAEVSRRFSVIGGSPLMRHTAAQASALEARLGLPVRACGRLWHPYPDEVLAELSASGAGRVLSLPLAPHSVDVYHAPIREAAARLGLEIALAPPWGEEPAFVDACVETVLEGLERFPEADRGEVAVILSAHSLPKRVVEAGDAYERQFRASAARVQARLEGRVPLSLVAFQSQGMTGDAWLGPDLTETFADVASRGLSRALVAPVGFVADHVETLYDLDVEAPRLAARAGLRRLERAPAMNDRPRFIDALEAVARRALPRSA